MESLIATDWLKDYDPLFDLFDAEMRGNDEQTTTTSNYHPNCLTTTAATSNGVDYFSEIGADLGSNQYCYNPFKQQTDELSLILGLEWMPLGLDLNSPASTSSTYSSNSSATSSSTSAYSSPNSSTIANNNNNNNNSSNNNNNNNNYNNNDTGSSVTRGGGAVAATTAASMNYIVANGSPSPLKKKKKSIKPRGTSLLAQPSPKTSKIIINSSNTTPSSAATPTISLTPVRQMTTTSRPLSTLLTINKQQTNISSTASDISSTRSPHHHHLLSLPHSNITSNISSYSSLCPNSQQVLRKENVTNITNTTTISTKSNHTPTRLGQRHQSLVSISTASTHHLTELEKAVRYCVKIEHAYSLQS